MTEKSEDFALFGKFLTHMIETVTAGHLGYKDLLQRTIGNEGVRNVLSMQYRQATGEQWKVEALDLDGSHDASKIYVNINLISDPDGTELSPGCRQAALIQEVFQCDTGEAQYSIHVQEVPEILREHLIGHPPGELLEHHAVAMLDAAGVKIISFEDYGSAVMVKLTSIQERL